MRKLNLKIINSLEKIKEKIASKEALILYFSSKNCVVCSVLKPKIKKEIIDNFTKIALYEIKSDENLDISSYFGVFQAPTILFYLDGKEFLREGRNISISAFLNAIKRPYEMFYGE
jgi:thiol-disulfide isomerase/thioredoxin